MPQGGGRSPVRGKTGREAWQTMPHPDAGFALQPAPLRLAAAPGERQKETHGEADGAADDHPDDAVGW